MGVVQQYSDLFILAEPRGTRRQKNVSNLDARVEKIFRIGDFGSIGFFIDVLNVFGENGYNISQDPGGTVYNDGTFQRHSNYGSFTGIYGLITFKVSARFTF